MSAKEGAALRRPPAVAVGGRAAAAPSRPIRLTAATPVRARKTGTASQPGSTKKAAAGAGSAAGTPVRAGSAVKKAATPGGGGTGKKKQTPLKSGTKGTGTKGKPPTPSRGGSAPAGRTHIPTSSRFPPASYVTPNDATLDATAVAGGESVHSRWSPAPVAPPLGSATTRPLIGGNESFTGSLVPTTYRSMAPASVSGHSVALTAASVAAATSAVTGDRYEPTQHRVDFTLRGGYTCIEAVPQSAALWLGNKTTGGLDVYSSSTGKLTVSLPPRGRGGGREGSREGVQWRADISLTSTPLLPSSTGPVAASTTSFIAAADTQDAVKPSALRASATHMWVGYEDGNVAVYDHLVLTFTTQGRFHTRPVIRFALLTDGTVVSASEDGSLVHWDREEKHFEAIAKLPSPAESASRDGFLTAMVGLPKSSLVVCGFHSGSLYVVDVVRAVDALAASNGAGGGGLPPHVAAVGLHDGRVNDLAVVDDVLFSASEDGSVCVTRLLFGLAGSSVVGRTTRNFSWRPLKRIQTNPCVRGLLPERHTASLYVAYADGLVERWSSNPDDDFGVEEVIREGLRPDPMGESLLSGGTKAGAMPGASGRRRGAAQLVGTSREEVTGLLAISAVETLQVLALANNGINKVWYGQRNTLEDHISSSINDLNAVISADAHDTAVWRERLSILKMKENERRGKYVLILEQLSEQRVLLKHFERWRRRVVGQTVPKSREVVVRNMAEHSSLRVLSLYFGKWAAFYDAEQKRLRRYTFAKSLELATKRCYIVSVFHRWQLRAARRRVRSASEGYVDVMERASQALVAGPCYYRWRRFAQERIARREGNTTLVLGNGYAEGQLTVLARKAQQQLLQRSLGKWLSAADSSRRRAQSRHMWEQYIGLFSQLREARDAKSLFQGWRRWARRRRKYAVLGAVAELRAEQSKLQAQQVFFLLWVQFAHRRRLDKQTSEIEEVQRKLADIEKESDGRDVFEKLQLKKRIDKLLEEEQREKAQLQQDQERLRVLQEGRDAILQRRESDRQQQRERRSSDDGAALVPVSASTIAALPTTMQAAMSGSGGDTSRASSSADTNDAGPLAAHANYLRHIVEEQRLSPAVLAHMPLAEAVNHVMAQLKGNLINMYTDMGLFRQVKDKRRAGTTAVAIFLENFAEVKRLIVSSLRRGGAGAAALPKMGAGAAAGGGRSSGGRWPLCLEALDSIPSHHCASVLGAIKTMIVAHDLIAPDEAAGIQTTSEEVVSNADWILLIAKACHTRRKPLLPANNRI